MSNYNKQFSKEMICIVCPVGCHLSLVKVEDEWSVRGNQCIRGVDYGILEGTNPTRQLTSTVTVEDGIFPRLPVRTNSPIPKDRIKDVMKEIISIKVKAPITMGAVIIENVLGLGVDIIASRSLASLGYQPKT